MLLAIDIGNSNSHFALICEDKITEKFQFPSDSSGHEEFFFRLSQGLRRTCVIPENLQSAIVSSVVPGQSAIVEKTLRDKMNIPFLFIDATLDCGITFQYDDLRTLGPDRVCCSVAAFDLTGGPVIAVDAGTAITYDCIDRNGVFIGGAIIPGFKTLAAGLARQTARLPEVDIIIPEKFPPSNTAESIQCGIVYGLTDAVNGMLGRMIKTLGPDTKIIVTGGDADIILKNTKWRARHEPDLVFHGLQILAKRFQLISPD